MKFKEGDRVTVELPGGLFTGTVHQVLPNYAWTGDTHYKILGSDPQPFETITSARGMHLAEPDA